MAQQNLRSRALLPACNGYARPGKIHDALDAVRIVRRNDKPLVSPSPVNQHQIAPAGRARNEGSVVVAIGGIENVQTSCDRLPALEPLQAVGTASAHQCE